VGQLIDLTERIARRGGHPARPGADSPVGVSRADARPPAAFYFALDCPVSYLVAERIERELGEITWVPLMSERPPAAAGARLADARSLAIAQRLPLVEPELFPFDARPVSRAAAYAVQAGRGAGFALAALRLAFAGGFDPSEPELIAEAAAACGLSVNHALEAADDPLQDLRLRAHRRSLEARGISDAPAVQIVDGWFSGFAALTRTSAFAAASVSFHAVHAEPG
jgi:2-hydroxychromene-2-carboxylate isomerase